MEVTEEDSKIKFSQHKQEKEKKKRRNKVRKLK